MRLGRLTAAAAESGAGPAPRRCWRAPPHTLARMLAAVWLLLAATAASSWTVVELEPATHVDFWVAVRERNQREMRSVALAVSDPAAAVYGQHLTAAEVKALTAPTAADSEAVKRWIERARGCVLLTQASTDRLLRVRCSAVDAEALLSTSFHQLRNMATQQQVVLAANYTLPTELEHAVASIYGLHGLPLSPRRRRRGAAIDAGSTVNVTPSVIAEAYNIRGVDVNRSSKNRQAVAEFQGATMNITDLQTFFKRYLPDAQRGDEIVHAFVGDYGAGSANAEASLDVQYLMSVAPGVKTDVYMYSDDDLCTGLKRWISQLLEEEDPPQVHSVSYGIQTDLGGADGTLAGPDYGCREKDIVLIDDDMAKLAARGLTLIVASGDEGSSYSLNCAEDSSTCMRDGIVLTGAEMALPAGAVRNAADCCSASDAAMARAFTYIESEHPTPTPLCAPGGLTAGEVLMGEEHWGVPADQFIGLNHSVEECCETAGQHGVGFTFLTGTTSLYPQIAADFPCLASGTGCCIVFDTIAGRVTSASAVNGSSGTNELKAPGTCELFSKVDGQKAGTGVSGGVEFAGVPKLFPSWPASSPWVTAVGSTRFADASKSSQVASTQFGSGGGFSAFILRDPVAAFQTKDAEDYLSRVTQEWPYPPPAAVIREGRGTPDVASLGENYQTIQQGNVVAQSGTSASTPVFAGMVSLLNEARLQKGMSPMGLLNPWLYLNEDAFTDIVVGTNALTGFADQGGSAAPALYGWNATVGWDPVTGLGAPDFQRMLAAALKGVPSDPEST